MENLVNRAPQRHAWFLAGLMALTLLAFIPVIQCGYIHFDDDAYLLDNPVVTRPISWWSIQALWTQPVMELWHPLTALTLHVGYQFWGLNPAGYHALNLAIHMGNVALLYALLVIVAASPWRAAAVAAVFAVHPLRVESVAWVVELKDVASVFFALVCMLAYIMNLRAPSRAYRGLCLLALALSLLYKPMFVTMPALLLLLDYWPLGRTPDGIAPADGQPPRQSAPWWRLVVEKVPVAMLVILSLVMTLGIMKATRMGGNEDITQPLSLRLANIPISLVRYIAEMFYFEGLTIHHKMPPFWPLWQVLGACALVLAASAASILLRRRLPMVFIGWWWFVIVLLPVIGIVRVADYSIADRYTYFSTVGLLIAMVYAIPARWMLAPSARWAAGCAMALILTLLSAATWREISYWKTMEALFARGLKVEPDNAFHHWAYAQAIKLQGRKEESEKYLLEAYRLDPNDTVIRLLVISSLKEKGKIDEGIAAGYELMKIVPRNADLYVEMAEMYGIKGDLPSALEMLNKALELRPGAPVRWINRGLVLLRLGKAQEAALDFQQALDIEPDNFAANSQLGFMYAGVGAPQDAVRHFRAALDRKPDAQVGIALAQQLAKLQLWAQSADVLAQVRTLEPRNATVIVNQALARLEAGDSARAAALLHEAVKADPDSAVAHDTLGMFLAQTGDTPGALTHLRRAQEISPQNPQRQKLISDLESKSAK